MKNEIKNGWKVQNCAESRRDDGWTRRGQQLEPQIHNAKADNMILADIEMIRACTFELFALNCIYFHIVFAPMKATIFDFSVLKL